MTVEEIDAQIRELTKKRNEEQAKYANQQNP